MAETSKSTLGKYELLEVIGDGAEGRVYRAVCIGEGVPGVARGEQVAVKRLKSTGHEKESQQFRRQIEILSKLRHPNIVSYKDSFVWRDKELEEDIHCLVMELLEGETLKAVIEKNRGGLPWTIAGKMLTETLSALQYASKNGVIHRDLKPSNIYVTHGHIPKLVDFGIARQDDGESTKTTSSEGAKGTFDYMAPDFALQHGGFRGDEQSDIFSFGVILYYTLAGALPFPPLGEGADRGYYIRWLGQQVPTPEFRHPVFRVLSHARSCIAKCIDPNREARFKTFDEVMASFKEVAYRKLKHGAEVYEFTDWLGKGGFGEVFRGRRASDGRDVAVKRLFSSGQASRFVREAKILRDAAHPNLTEYVDFVEVRLREDEREFYLILEYLDGMPEAGLRDRIKDSESGLDPIEALRLFIGYLDCLAHLHGQGIIHRDIKPGNLYAPFGNPNRAKIFDLGIAHDEEGTRTHGQVPGTLDFMPPEFATQTSGRGSAQSDIYSIGVTLYQSLTKELPFPRLPTKESEAWIAFFKRSTKPVDCTFAHPVFKTWPELVPLLKRALAHDPKNRFESAGAMRDALKAILEKRGVAGINAQTEDPTAFFERPTMVQEPKPAAVPVEPPAEVVEAPKFEEEDPHEAATKVADLPRIEREMAKAAAPVVPPKPAAPVPPPVDSAEVERQRLAAEAAAKEAARKKQEEAERLEKERQRQLEQERERKAIEEAERKKREQAERERKALEDAERKKREEAERERKAIEDAERKKREEAQRIERERQRKIAEEIRRKEEAEAEKRRQEEAERQAIIDAERAEKRRQLTAKLVKYAIIFVVAAGAAAAGYIGWQKAQYVMREKAYTSAAAQANSALKSGDYSAAIAAAQKAMTVHSNDAAMTRLIQDAQTQAKQHESFAGALKSAQAAFDGHDYSNAVSWATAALEKKPADLTATRLQADAQRFLDDYQKAVKQANAAYKQNEFEVAIAAADKALAIFSNDTAMRRLKSDAQTAQANLEAYRAAMKTAQTAFEARDYAKAVTAAGEALQKIPNEENATRMQKAAQKYLDEFRDATNLAQSLFQKNDFDGAVTAADKALAIFSKDAAMLKLKADAQAQAKLRAAYTKAYKAAQTAFEGRDYTSAVARATEALQQIPGDAGATKIRDSAQNFLNDYNAATQAANAAAVANNFDEAIKSADKALAIYPSDSAMQQLKANAQKSLANLKAYREAMAGAQTAFDGQDYNEAARLATTALQKIPNDAAATKLLGQAQSAAKEFNDLAAQAQAELKAGNYPAAMALASQALAKRKDDAAMLKIKTDTLLQLDRSLVTMLESFNVTVPADLRYAQGKKASTLGAIGDAGKPFYQAQVDALEKSYRAGGWLGEKNRQASMQDLRKAIDRWE